MLNGLPPITAVTAGMSGASMTDRRPTPRRGPGLTTQRELNSYKIEKIRCAVAVTMVNGDVLPGDIFLNPTSRFRSEPQTPAEFLEEPEPWFALADQAGHAFLVAKANVETVDADHVEWEGVGPEPHPAPVRMTLNSGATVAGTVSIDAPPTRARLLDFINSHHGRFICVALDDRVVLVNRLAIAHVQELT